MRWPMWSSKVQPIGVDIGSNSIKMVQLAQGSHGLEVAASARVTSVTSDDSDPIASSQSMKKALREALSAGSFRGDACVSSVAPGDLQIRSVRLPRMSDNELDKAAKFEAGDRFGVDPDDLEVAWIRAGEVNQTDESRDEIVLIAAPRESIERHLDVLISVGLRPLAVDVPFVAATRTCTWKLRRKSDRSTVSLIVDVGASSTTVTVARGQDTAFLKPINIGGQRFTSAVSKALTLDAQAATDIRIDRMNAAATGETDRIDPRIDRAVFDAVRPLITDLVHEVALCLRYYCVTFRGARPQSIFVCGGDGAEPYLAKALTDELQIEANIIDPLDAIVADLPANCDPLHALHRPLWTTGIGLSLRQMARGHSLGRDLPEEPRDVVKRGAA